MTQGVCFACSMQAELVPGHRICTACHDPARCRRAECVTGQSKLDGPRTSKTRYKDKLMEALARLGGQATTAELASETGLRSVQITCSLRAANGVTFMPPKGAAKNVTGGLWTLETAIASDLTGVTDFEAVAA